MSKEAMLALTQEQYEELIILIKSGFEYIDNEGKTRKFRPNERLATALVIEATTGLRIGDIVQLRLIDIVKDGGRYRLDVKEQKTGKKRDTTIKPDIRDYLLIYAVRNGIKEYERLFPLTTRGISKQLKIAANYMELTRIGSHSFRKLFATRLYEESGKDIELVRRVLNHSSSAITQRYIGINQDRIELALQNHVKLI